MKRSLSLALILLTLLAVNARPAASQQPTQSKESQTAAKPNTHDDKIFSQVFKLVGQDVTVKLISGKEWHGRISSVEDMGFKLVEVDLGQIILITYRDTNKVYKGYSERNVLGQRINPQSKKIAGVASMAGLLGFLIIVASQIR